MKTVSPGVPSQEAPPEPTADSNRVTAAAILRAVADLIEARPDIQLPGSDIDFYVRGDDAPAVMAAIASALPCDQWQASVSHSGEHEWLDLSSGRASALQGTRVRISAPTSDACAATGTKTVTVWRPAGALTGLLGTDALPER